MPVEDAPVEPVPVSVAVIEPVREGVPVRLGEPVMLAVRVREGL